MTDEGLRGQSGHLVLLESDETHNTSHQRRTERDLICSSGFILVMKASLERNAAAERNTVS